MNKLRTIIIIGTILALFLALFFFVQFTGFLFTIQEKYSDAPSWLIFIYIAGIILISLVGVIFVYRVSKFGSSPQKIAQKKAEIIDDDSFYSKLKKLENEGGEVSQIKSDWNNLMELRKSESVTIAMFGEINAGKSSIIKTLIGKDIEISAKGGQTKTITNYNFEKENRKYNIFDMPGFNEFAGFSEDIIREKAIKSHIVAFVMQEDITNTSYEAYKHLQSYKKPIIIAINKADYYSEEEQQQITNNIHLKLENKTRSNSENYLKVVWVSSDAMKNVEKHYDNGEIKTEEVLVAGNIDSLIYAIEEKTFDRLAINNSLDNSYYKSLEKDIDGGIFKVRHERAKKIVKSYSQKAIFGGMAAIGPGTDVLLQGYLGMGMAKDICKVYEINVKQVDLESMMDMLGSKMKKELAVVLALLGNICKAFPGIGTVAGGVLHAVAYGIIFESVGKAMILCIEKNNGLQQKDLVIELEKQISTNLEKRAIKIAKSVFLKSK